MKKIFSTLALLFISLHAFAQADKPSMMVIPDMVWFNKMGYVNEVALNGRTRKVPDYERAFTENSEVSDVIGTISELFQQRGFEITSLWEAYQSMQEEEAQEMALEADGYGDETAMGVEDQVMNSVKPDIKLGLFWETSTVGFNKTMRVTVKAFDSFTNKQIGNLQNTTPPMSKSAFTADMLKQAVSDGFDQLTSGLMTYFQSLQAKGREIKMAVRVTANSPVSLYDEVEGTRLNLLLQQWVRQHSNNGSGSMAPNPSRDRVNFQGIRIPLVDQYGQKMTAYEWANNEGLESYLKSVGVSARVDPQGMGSIVVRIGAQ